jgi:hypothetical protein
MDGDIIHIDCYSSFINQIAEYGVHHCLEGCQRVSQTKKHDEGCFPSVLLFNGYFVVPLLDVAPCKFSASSEVVN